MANNTLIGSDNFASGSLAASWAAHNGLLVPQVVNVPPMVIEPNVTGGTAAAMYWTGTTTADQINEITVNAMTFASNNQIQLRTRWNNSAQTGYVLALGTGGTSQFKLFRQDNSGTFVQLGLTVTGLAATVTGDIWSMMSAGSVHYIYKNGTLLLQTADPTYKTGQMGVYLNCAVLAQVRISAWRGYSAVQQDGIWQKQGVVIAPIAGDLSSSGYGAYQLAKPIYEGNAQLLSGIVYKSLVSSGGLTTGNIFYVESLDGISWTRSGSPVIAAYTNQSLIKVGSTYYCYATPQGGGGTLHLFTSSDMISWSDQGVVLTTGGGGAWDTNNLFLLTIADIVAGTWYGLYSATNGDGTALFKVGLATSPDGVVWTKSGSNPVISNAATSDSITKVGSTYYGWFPAGPSAPMSGSGGYNFDPAECARLQSTDLINWTNRTQSLHHSEMFDLVNSQHGQCSTTTIIDIGGKAYQYGISGQDQQAPQNYQTYLAIAPGPIASIVTASEDAVQQIATDPFTSGAGDLSANWTTPTGATKLKIVAGPYVEATATATTCAMYYSGKSFTNNHYSDVTIQALSTGSYALPCVRMQSGALSLYTVVIQGPTGSLVAGCQLQKKVSGASTSFGPTESITLNVGDVIRLQVIDGSDGFPVLSVFQNGSMILQYQDYTAQFASGAPGMFISASTSLANAQISAWAGGNSGVIYPAGGGSWMQAFRNFINKTGGGF